MYTIGNETKICGKGPIGKGNLYAFTLMGLTQKKKIPSDKHSQLLSTFQEAASPEHSAKANPEVLVSFI